MLSSYCNNDYVISSNNSINENIYNMQKLKKSPKYRIKNLLKPIMKMLSSKSKSKKTSKCSSCNCSRTSSEMDYSSEMYDNESNETLESNIIDEMKQSGEYSQDQMYVPVHFVRIPGNGTFFWTTMPSNVDHEIQQATECEKYQLPQLQQHVFDRWIQA